MMKTTSIICMYLTIGILVLVGKCVCYRLPHAPRKLNTAFLNTLASAALQSKPILVDDYPLPIKLVHILADTWKAIAYPNPQQDATELHFASYGVLKNQTALLVQYYLHCRDFASENAIVMPINQFVTDTNAQEGLLIQYIDFPVFSKDGDDFDHDEHFYEHSHEGLVGINNGNEGTYDKHLVEENMFPEYESDETVIRKTQEWVHRCKNKIRTCSGPTVTISLPILHKCSCVRIQFMPTYGKE